MHLTTSTATGDARAAVVVESTATPRATASRISNPFAVAVTESGGFCSALAKAFTSVLTVPFVAVLGAQAASTSLASCLVSQPLLVGARPPAANSGDVGVPGALSLHAATAMIRMRNGAVPARIT